MKTGSSLTLCENGAPDATLLTTEEAAALLRIATKTMRHLCASRQITAIHYCRRWYIPEQKIENFKRAHLSATV